jgi:undecaprenyl-diphosphatase
LGEETVFIVLGLIFFWCINKKEGYYLLSIGFIGTVINQFLKLWFRVPRPWVKDKNFTIVESAREAATGYSFPSGHTQTSVGLFGGIARATKIRALRMGMIVLAVLVALSRMYLGVHTPADVLVSVAVALFLVFAAYPLFKKAEKSPRVMYGILFSFLGLMVAYILFVMLYRFPEAVYHVDEVHNLISARENGFTLLGCAVGLIVVYAVDQKWTHFDTKAVWWAQVLKVTGGLALVVAVKALLKTPLNVLLVNEFAARSVRYFLMVVVGGALWPMTFKFFAGLGKK